MKARNSILISRKAAFLGGAMLVAMLPATGALAQTANESSWYSNGSIEAGTNIWLKKPGDGFGKTSSDPYWLTPLTSDSRQKMDEYGKVPRSVFLNDLGVQAGSKDGRYAVDIWADNVGMDNQRYYLGIYEPGRQYFNMGWDQTPHLLSSSAKSIFGGVGSSRLTVDPTSRGFLQSHMGQTGGTGNSNQPQADRTCIDDYINGRDTLGAGCLTVGNGGTPLGQLVPGAAPMANIELKTLREKFTAGYRNTMLDNWDFNVDYSHEHRTGTRPLGIEWGYAFGNGVGAAGTITSVPLRSGSIEVPQPLDDRTQIVNGAGEYSGTTPWGTRWNTSVKYAGSSYTNNIKSIDVDNPFCSSCVPYNGVGIANAAVGPNLLRYSLYPDNSANGVTWNTAVNLPIFKTRYTSNVQYTMFRQNDAFIDGVTNGITGANSYAGQGLDGKVDTFLTNNVLYSHLTNDLTNTVRMRYYDRKDSTPVRTFVNTPYSDSGILTTPYTREQTSHSKLNLADDLKWQANRTWAFGTGYFFERYVFQNGEVDSTNESGAKAFVNATWRLATVRSSLQYSERRYNTYLAAASGQAALDAQRFFFVANRNRTKADTIVELAAFKNVTISPNGGLRWDEYPADLWTGQQSLGVKYDRSWNLGSDVNVRVTPALRLTFGYNHEEHYLRLNNCCGTTSNVFNDSNRWSSDIRQFYNTYTASTDWKAIPGKLDFTATYLAALSTEANQTQTCSSNNGSCNGLGTGIATAQFPDEKNKFQRFSLLMKYYVDPSVVKQMGWFGDVTAKLRYTWERNNNSNWATDNYSPYSPSAADGGTDVTNGGRSLFLAYNNPNYTAQIIAISLAAKW